MLARAHPLIRAGSILLVLVAIVAAAAGGFAAGTFDPTRFFAYFTIQSNLIGVVAFGWLLLRPDRPRSRGLELLRGAAALYLTVTFFVVIALLSGADVALDQQWIDIALHKIFPVVVVADWLLDPPDVVIGWRDSLLWLVYPIAWTLVTMVRGAVGRLVPVPVPRPGEGRVRPGGRRGRGDHRGLRGAVAARRVGRHHAAAPGRLGARDAWLAPPPGRAHRHR